MTRRVLIAAVVVLALVAVLGAAAHLYLSSGAFKERVRGMAQQRLESMTGGRVEFRNVWWNLGRLEFELDDVTIHGTEPQGESPYAHADRIFLRAKIISLFEREISLSQVTIDGPSLHLIVDGRGISNAPRPGEAGRKGLQELFDLAIGHLELNNGRFLVNDAVVPFSVAADQVAASVRYVPGRYEGSLRAAELKTSYAPQLRSAVELAFQLAPNELRLKSLKWASPRSHVDANGTVSDFAHPKFDLAYQGSVDVQEFAAILRTPELRSGAVELQGRGTYSDQGLASEGKVALRNLEWRDTLLRAANINGGAQFSLTPDRLVFSKLFATAFGGSISGSSEVRNWSSVLSSATQKHPVVGTADLRLEALQLRQLTSALSTRSLPLEKLAMAGRASGTTKARWIGRLSAADADINIDVVPPAHPDPHELPVTARLQAGYHGSRDTLDVSQLNAATRSTRIDAGGSLGTSTANLHVAVNSTDISEFGPMLAIFGEDTLPAKLNGHASFNGTVSGKLRSPTVVGHLQISDFDSLLTASILGALPEPKSFQPVPIHWDELRADVSLSSSSAIAKHAFVRRGGTRIAFDSTATLNNWRFDRTSPLSIHARLVNVEVNDLEHFVGRNDPVGGKVTTDFDLSGSLSDLHGGGHVIVSDLHLGPERFTGLTADLRFVGRETQWSNVVLRHDGAQITGTAAYQLDTGAFRFQAVGKAFELARLQSIQTPKYKFAGLADFELSGSGTAAAPVINGSMTVKSVIINGEPVGDISLTATTRGTTLQLKGRAHIEDAALDVDGTAQLVRDWPADLHVTLKDFDIDAVLRAYLGNRITGHSSIAGSATVRGPLRSPLDWNISGTLDRVSAEIEKLRFQNPADAPIRFSMAERVLTLRQSHLVAEDTDVITSGTIELAGAHEMKLRSKGSVSMKLLQTLNPELRASGSTVFDVTIGGTFARPDVNGPAEVRNVAISFIDVPNGLSNVQGFLQFQHNRLAVESLVARSGGGNLDVRGFISYANGLAFDLNARSSEIRLRYPAGISALASADLRYVGSIPDSRLTGTVTINRFALNSRFDFAQYLASSKQPESMVQPNSPLANLHLDVHIVSASELQMQTSAAHLLGNVDLRLRGTAAHPVLLGRVNVLEGDITIAGTKYHIDRGDVTFSNPTRIEPVLNVEATARIRDYDVSLGIHGVPPDHLRSSYRSDPPLPESDVIALLALGRTTDQTTLTPQPTQNYTETASNAILGEALNETVSSRGQKLFGLGRIKIDPQAGGPESNPNARLTIEQQVSDRVTLTYITNLSQSAQQIVQVEYNVDRNFTIIAVRDQNGVLGFDVRYRRRKR